MEQLVSVIVPVYNVEKYLCQCIDTILSQTYRNLEVILVDDGSIDGSPKICDDYSRKDQRIFVIHKKNGGLSDARNEGLKIAKGKYVMFMDSDDYWADTEVLNRVMGQVDGYDFVNFNCKYYYQKDGVFKNWAPYPQEVVSDRTNKEKIISLICYGIFPMSACMKIIDRQFLEKNDIWFIKGIVSEDIPWFLELVNKSRHFKFVNEYMYIYRKQAGETISSSFSAKKYADLFAILSKETQKIQHNVTDRDLNNALLSFMAYEYCNLMGMVNHFPSSERKQQIVLLEKYAWLLQYDLHPKVRKVKLCLQFFGVYLTRWILLFYINRVVHRN